MPEPGDSTDTMAATGAWLAVDVVRDAGDWDRFGNVDKLVEAAAAALARHPSVRSEVRCDACIALSDDPGVRRLNATYRGKDKPTNVLSFPSLPMPAHSATSSGPAGVRPLGDIVLAQGTILAEAALQGTPPADHLQHLVVHGLLHLLGYDHETEVEATAMESIEIEVLASLGIDSPYTHPLADTAPAATSSNGKGR
ncbi:MAG: rRNA maturation RNase YbeY [Hyphomicrobium sp.]